MLASGGDSPRVEMRGAATGRPRDPRVLRASEVVRLELRLPAVVAAALFEQAHERHASVSATAAEILETSLLATTSSSAVPSRR